MKAISIRQPWAGMIARGQKTIETRTWTTKYRGPLLIVAGRQIDYAALRELRLAGVSPTTLFPQGMAIAVVELYDVKTMAAEHEGAAFVKSRPGLFAWYLRGLRTFEPFSVKGRLGLFDVAISLDPAEVR